MVYFDEGDYEQAIADFSEAINVNPENLAVYYKGVAISELYRIKGELLLTQVAIETEVEKQFRKAIEAARSQEAKSLELRAVTSLSRLWQKQGKGEEAFEILDEICCQFTEGFDALDLMEAKILLEEISLFEPTL